MEVMEIATATVKDVFIFVQCHPYYAAISFVIGVFALLKFHSRLTLGMCDCTTDMTGKTVIITGANSGIGKVTAQELAKRGARVIMACRNRERGQKALDEIVKSTGSQNIVLKELDLCSFASVRSFARDIIRNEKELHILINNAGLVATERELTTDGCEKVMQSNHLGHFLLTLMLIDLLKKSSPSRIINVSSIVHKFSKLNLDDLNFTQQPYDTFLSYNSSKLANILFTRELAKRLRGTGVTANSLHPGIVETEISKNLDSLSRFVTFLLMFIFGKSTFEGAQTTIHLAMSPNLEHVTGKYFDECKIAKESRKAKNDEMAAKLWRVSELLVGLTSVEGAESSVSK